MLMETNALGIPIYNSCQLVLKAVFVKNILFRSSFREKAQGYEKRRHFQNMNGEYTRMFRKLCLK